MSTKSKRRRTRRHKVSQAQISKLVRLESAVASAITVARKADPSKRPGDAGKVKRAFAKVNKLRTPGLFSLRKGSRRRKRAK